MNQSGSSIGNSEQLQSALDAAFKEYKRYRP